MWAWLKNLIPNPKKIIGGAVDALDFLVPIMAKEWERNKEKLNAVDSTAKCQWAIDQVQAFLRDRFNLDA